MSVQALIVKLAIGQFGNTRQDPAITAEVTAQHGLSKKSGRWVKHKLRPESLEAIRKLAGAVRQWHYSITCPWDEGARLLCESARGRYDAGFDRWQAQWEETVAEFVLAYPGEVEAARQIHGDTFLAGDYPTQEAVGEQFTLEVRREPMPQATHFDGVLRENYGAMLEAQNEGRITAAIRDTWTRLLAPVQHMAEKLASPDAVFRDTLVENVTELLDTLPALNITNDAGLRSAGEAIKTTLAGLDASVLRENKVVRADVARAAARIVSQFGAMGARKFAVPGSQPATPAETPTTEAAQPEPVGATEGRLLCVTLFPSKPS